MTSVERPNLSRFIGRFELITTLRGTFVFGCLMKPSDLEKQQRYLGHPKSSFLGL